MNIFVLDKNPSMAAQMLCDCHVRKMCVETAQILSGVMLRRGLPLIEYNENIWLGVTTENQQRLELRTLDLQAWHGKRWLSVEPLLERIDLEVNIAYDNSTSIISTLDWVVVGAESGTNRRPCSLDWVRQIVRQCQTAKVPVFVKQLDIAGKLVSDIDQFPEDLQIRQVPWRHK